MTGRAPATAEARLVIHAGDAETATALVAALAPDNGPHCTARAEGPEVHVEVPEAALGSVAATVDDVLAALRAAAASGRAGR